MLCVFSEGTRQKQEEQPMWFMKTSSMPRTPVTICQASTSATATWSFSTTTQTEYVEDLKACISNLMWNMIKGIKFGKRKG